MTVFFLFVGGRTSGGTKCLGVGGRLFGTVVVVGGVVVAAGSMDCWTLRLVAARRVVAIGEIVTHTDCMEWVHGKLESV